jgi:ferritin-like protein
MSATYNEPSSELSPEARDVHRALASFVEELEAVDYYNQRVDVATDGALREILAHNRDEEIEHAVMLLEWLRRRLPKFDEELRTYLFTSAPIAHGEGSDPGKTTAHDSPAAPSTDLGIGKFKK